MTSEAIEKNLKLIEGYLQTMSDAEKQTQFGQVVSIAYGALINLQVLTDLLDAPPKSGSHPSAKPPL